MESDRKTGGETLCVPDADWTVSEQEIQQQLQKRACSGNHVPGGGERALARACVRVCLSSPAIFLFLLLQLLRHPCVCAEGSLTASLVD